MNISVARTGYVGMNTPSLLVQYNHVMDVDVVSKKGGEDK